MRSISPSLCISLPLPLTLTRSAADSRSPEANEMLDGFWFCYRFGDPSQCGKIEHHLAAFSFGLLSLFLPTWRCTSVCPPPVVHWRKNPRRLSLPSSASPSPHLWGFRFQVMSLSDALAMSWGTPAHMTFVPPASRPGMLVPPGPRSGPAAWSKAPVGNFPGRPWVLQESSMAAGVGGGSARNKRGARGLKMAGEKPKGSKMLQGVNLGLIRCAYCCDCESSKRWSVRVIGEWCAHVRREKAAAAMADDVLV